jgi:hypothetical protein
LARSSRRLLRRKLTATAKKFKGISNAIDKDEGEVKDDVSQGFRLRSARTISSRAIATTLACSYRITTPLKKIDFGGQGVSKLHVQIENESKINSKETIEMLLRDMFSLDKTYDT